MKRFTETTKWRDPWFRRLSPSAKLLWLYAVDHCDCAGVVEIDLDAVAFDVGEKIKDACFEEIGDRMQPVGSMRFFIPKFIHFQYGEVTPSCPAHKPIIKAIASHRIERDSNGYKYPSDRVSNTLLEEDKNRKGQEEEKKRTVKQEPKIGFKDVGIKGSTVLPDSLADDPKFVEAWKSWIEHRRQLKKVATITAQDLQLLDLSKMGPFRATEAINHSIKRGWVGIFEDEKTNGSKREHVTMELNSFGLPMPPMT